MKSTFKNVQMVFLAVAEQKTETVSAVACAAQIRSALPPSPGGPAQAGRRGPATHGCCGERHCTFSSSVAKVRRAVRDAGAESGDGRRSRAVGGGFGAAASAAACALAFPAEIRLKSLA